MTEAQGVELLAKLDALLAAGQREGALLAVAVMLLGMLFGAMAFVSWKKGRSGT